ncbi:GlsB/YeaQ/YmgE family stress response membrane protein [Streptomyces acidicola]|uniref:GlsB/YeaQ/YmgE family stress response membrane protein n=1 Tax=Streptomyces acidicola TaxID=2596892 RepID=A0A5N8WVE9_9ACTN|nr:MULTISPECIES: GlsB/YeaQ/YmgE family stress response membrane protein [Streptomyces]MBA2809606.1 GlsB/YeaQ/YmgE family stress response membrane protein [Streptomyces sp. KM273126]MPY51393.1 GlsB/YeaQ/YmgE family stress response membrane protein [Streptomyces acidicola]
MGVIAWVVLGLLAGAIAKAILPGRDPGGLIGTTFIGIAGAFIGGWLSAKLLDRPVEREFFDAATWGSAIAGALVLLIGYRIFFGNSRD